MVQIQLAIFDGDELDKVRDHANKFLKRIHPDNIIDVKYRKKLVAKTWTNQDQSVKSWWHYSIFIKWIEH